MSGSSLVAEIAIVAATICYACAAIFGRGFKGLDPMAPAAGSLLCGAAVLIPLEPGVRAALDAGAVGELGRWRCSGWPYSRPRPPS